MVVDREEGVEDKVKEDDDDNDNNNNIFYKAKKAERSKAKEDEWSEATPAEQLALLSRASCVQF